MLQLFLFFTMYKQLILTLFVFASFCFPVFASHYAGGEITYRCNPSGGPQNYTLRLTVYLDCSGVPPASSEYICIKNGTSVGSNSNLTINLIPSTSYLPNPVEITPKTPNTLTTCASGGTLPGFKRAIYEGNVDLLRVSTLTSGIPNILSTPIILTVSNCCRTSYNNVSGAEFVISTRIYRLTNPCDNDSPYFEDRPMIPLHVNQSFVGNSSAFDRNGDNLSYALSTAKQGSCSFITDVSYFGSFSNPFGATGFMFFNQTAEWLVTPPTIGKFAFATTTTEYKRYSSIGDSCSFNQVLKMCEIEREVAIIVDNAPTYGIPNMNVFPSSANNDSTICKNTPWTHTLNVTAPNTTDTLNVYVTGAMFGNPINASCNLSSGNCATISGYSGIGGQTGVGNVSFIVQFNPSGLQTTKDYSFKVHVDLYHLGKVYSHHKTFILSPSCCIVTEVKDVEQNQTLVQLYPNPTQQELTVQWQKNTPVSIIVNNMLGQTVYQQHLNSETQTHINTHTWGQGVYFLHWQQNGKQYTQKFVKE